ncbi:MAG: hypothetical protein AAF938_09845 [Myxococcota bacterium]
MRNTLIVSCVLALAACGSEEATAKAPAAPLASGKADGSLEIVDQGPIALGEDAGEDLAPDLAHSWTFELTEAQTVRFTTSGAERVDTVLYLTQGEAELATDDDGGEGLFSNLEADLEAGTYEIVVGGYANRQTGSFALQTACVTCGTDPVEPVDPPEDAWALARDVNLMNVAFTDATETPDSFERADADFVRLSGPEWWQRWSGGATQSFNWSEGTDFGKRCGQASAIRLEAIWNYEETDADGNVTRPGREAFERLRDVSNWRGTMYNWTEDISEGGRASFSPASMWAWRTSAIKWINVVHADGSCDLPTLGLVQDFSRICSAEAEGNDGEFQGCLASAR